MTSSAYSTGQGFILGMVFQGDAFTGPFYVGLGNGSVPSGRTDDLSDITEVTGSGYARISVNQDDTAAGWSLADNVVTSPTLTWTSTETVADWTDADYAFLTLSASGTSAPAVLLTCTPIDTVVLSAGDSTPLVFSFQLGG